MIKFVLILSLLTNFLSANHIRWMSNYDQALQKAKRDKKPIMILLNKHGCKETNKIIKKFFMNQSYIDTLNRDFINIIITYEGKESYPVEMFYSTSFPTLFFVDSKYETFLSKPLYKNQINIKNIITVLKTYE